MGGDGLADGLANQHEDIELGACGSGSLVGIRLIHPLSRRAGAPRGVATDGTEILGRRLDPCHPGRGMGVSGYRRRIVRAAYGQQPVFVTTGLHGQKPWRIMTAGSSIDSH